MGGNLGSLMVNRVNASDFTVFPDKKHSRFYLSWNSNIAMCPFLTPQISHLLHPNCYSPLNEPWSHRFRCRQQTFIVLWHKSTTWAQMCPLGQFKKAGKKPGCHQHWAWRQPSSFLQTLVGLRPSEVSHQEVPASWSSEKDPFTQGKKPACDPSWLCQKLSI